MSKTCPSCQKEIPHYAKLCKYCFHDFLAKKPFQFPLKWSIALFVLAFLMMLGANHVATTQIAHRYILDGETKSLLMAKSTSQGTSIDRLSFDKITELQHVIGGETAPYEIIAVINNGDRLVLQTSPTSLSNTAKNMATSTGLNFTETNNHSLPIK